MTDAVARITSRSAALTKPKGSTTKGNFIKPFIVLVLLDVFGVLRDRYQFRTHTLECAADVSSTPAQSIDLSESADALMHVAEASARGGTCLVNESFSLRC